MGLKDAPVERIAAGAVTVELVARVFSTGRSSMTVGVTLHAEDLRTGDRRPGTRGRFVLVALDAHGKPTGVPPLAPPPDGQP